MRTGLQVDVRLWPGLNSPASLCPLFATQSYGITAFFIAGCYSMSSPRMSEMKAAGWMVSLRTTMLIGIAFEFIVGPGFVGLIV